MTRYAKYLGAHGSLATPMDEWGHLLTTQKSTSKWYVTERFIGTIVELCEYYALLCSQKAACAWNRTDNLH